MMESNTFDGAFWLWRCVAEILWRGTRLSRSGLITRWCSSHNSWRRRVRQWLQCLKVRNSLLLTKVNRMLVSNNFTVTVSIPFLFVRTINHRSGLWAETLRSGTYRTILQPSWQKSWNNSLNRWQAAFVKTILQDQKIEPRTVCCRRIVLSSLETFSRNFHQVKDKVRQIARGKKIVLRSLRE